jgi:hypothetical protein
MPITPISNKYYDYRGTVGSFLKANVGDLLESKSIIKESISVITGADAYFQLNPVENIITWTGGDFELEGFREGDAVLCEIFSNGGGLVTSWNAVVQAIDTDMIDLDTIPAWIDATIGQIFRITSKNRRGGLIVDLNNVSNGVVGNEFSTIDGEVSRFKFITNSISVGSTVNGISVGNQSGQYIISASIKLNSEANYVRQWEVTFRYILSGINEPNLFTAANCQKLFLKFRWQRIYGDPANNLIYIQSEDADTGYFDQAFNNGGDESAVIQAINSVDYQDETTCTVVVEHTGSLFGIGACYCPQDETYYKNKTYSQAELSMALPTTNLILAPLGSQTNPDSAEFTLNIQSITSLSATQKQIVFKFQPDGNFYSFMDSREDGDRLFKIWIRADDENLLVFDDQLTKTLPVGGPITFAQHTFLDHSQNFVESATSADGYSANIEDDLAFTGAFLVPLFATGQNLYAKIIAFNSTTNESFILNSVNFNFDTVPMIGGKYILNETLPVISTLPNTSEKLNARLYLDPAYDVPASDLYGVRIYLPFLYRWEYWLNQPNAADDFYPNQNKNWFPYGNTGDWKLKLRLESIVNDLLYFYENDLDIKNYDSDAEIDQNIELIIDSTDQIVNIITEGMLMRVRATHTINSGMDWNPAEVWGMITVEPTESSPRWICSTVVPFDNNNSNPLTPLSGLYCDLQIVGNVATMECYFDPTKVNLENGCKFTTKIKGCFQERIETGKEKSDTVVKQKSDGVIKQKA